MRYTILPWKFPVATTKLKKIMRRFSIGNDNGRAMKGFRSLFTYIQNITRFGERLMDGMLGLVSWLPWTLLAGMLPGIIVWQFRYAFQLRNMFTNQVTTKPIIALYAGISSAVYLGLCFGAYRLFRQRHGSTFTALCRSVNRFASGFLLVLIYIFLQSRPVSEKAPFVSMLLCTVAGIIAAVIAYGVPWAGTFFGPRDGKLRKWPLLVAVAFAAVWAAAIVHLEFTHHAALRTNDWDFGLYINTMWKSLHGDLLGCSLFRMGNHGYLHFDPILILLSPILLIYPGPESLIVLQGVWVASGVIPLYLLASRHSKNEWLGVILATAYLLHPALHGPSIYDFHSLTLAAPLLLWCLHFLDAQKMGWFFFFICLLLITREDMSGLAILIGLYAYISGKSKPVALGVIALSGIYALVAYIAVIYHGHSYSGYFKEMQGESRPVLLNIVLTALTNPMFMIKYMLTERKLIYILQLIVPLLFLPIFARKHLVLYLGGLAITLLGTKNCLSSISMQYSIWWLPFMFAAVPTAIDACSRGLAAQAFKLDAARLRAALVIGVLLSSFTMSVAYGAFWPNPAFRTGYDKLVRELDENHLERLETVEKIKKMIPPDATVMASQHLVSHFAIRDWIWGFDRPGYHVDKPEYAVIWKRDMRSKKDYKVKLRKQNLKMLENRKLYKRVLRENGITLYKRKSSD